MVRALLYPLIGALTVLVLASCSNPRQPKPDCTRAFAIVSQEITAMAEEGHLKKAQAKAELVKPCYDYDASYWMMRTRLLPSLNPPNETTHADAVKAVNYMNQALKAEPENNLVRIMKSGFLFTAKKYDKAETIYESEIRELLNNGPSDKDHPLTEAIILEVAPYYIDAMRRQSRISEAQAQLVPYLVWICETWPKYRRQYARLLIWLSDQLAPEQRRPIKSRSNDPANQDKALDNACVDFSQRAAELR